MAPRILYVDDEEALRELVQTHLSLEGYEIATAGDGYEAIELLMKNTYDLVLLDLHMPGIDGLGVLRHLKEHKIALRMIVLSGDTHPAVLDECASLGVEDYLIKPYNFHELMATIDRVLAA
jgi:CheY-like chemotaxis protein